MGASRVDPDPIRQSLAPGDVLEDALSHRTTTNVPRTNEQNTDHARNSRVHNRVFQAVLGAIAEASFAGAESGLVGNLHLAEDVGGVVLDRLEAKEELGWRLTYTYPQHERVGGPVQTQTKIETQIRRRFTVDEYHRMAEAGILHEDDRVELIGGEIVEMSPIGGRHAACVREINHLLSRRLGDEIRVDVQSPVKLNEEEEPQPDLAVIRTRDYENSLPTPEDVLLLIEVADTSLAYDRGVKLPLYAHSGIPEVWIVDINGKVVERYTEPSEEGYRLVRRAGRDGTLESAVLPALTLQVGTVLG
jgi:Uma2 family endonuclease